MPSATTISSPVTDASIAAWIVAFGPSGASQMSLRPLHASLPQAPFTCRTCVAYRPVWAAAPAVIDITAAKVSAPCQVPGGRVLTASRILPRMDRSSRTLASPPDAGGEGCALCEGAPPLWNARRATGQAARRVPAAPHLWFQHPATACRTLALAPLHDRGGSAGAALAAHQRPGAAAVPHVFSPLRMDSPRAAAREELSAFVQGSEPSTGGRTLHSPPAA